MGRVHQRYRNFWTPSYWRKWREADSPYRRHKSEKDRQIAVRLAGLQGGERVLEIGCGYGWISEALINSSRIQWVGIDISESMISHCVRVIPGGSGLVADALFLPFCAGTFDVVLCSGVLMHLENERGVLAEMARVLRSGGRLVISGNNLLSPFALPAWIWNAKKENYKQSFRLPWTYKKWLEQLEFRVEHIVGDTIFALGLHLPIGTFPPERLFKYAVFPDRFLDGPLRYLAYEVWFSAVKCSST